MIYHDKIYGKIKIEEPVVLELIKTLSFQRLKEISQVVHAPIYLKILNLPFIKPQVYRFEHSLGVFVLLKIFGAPFEEQISGLIHDLSIPVFSHSVDYALKEGSEIDHSFHDKIHKEFVKNSEIPKILKRFGFDINYILDDKNFPLKEKLLPELCADRIDYSIRDAVAYGIISKKEAEEFFENLRAIKNSWVFEDFESAKKFAKFYKKMNDYFYSGIATALMFRTVGDSLAYSLSRGIISQEDLFTTDERVLRKIKKFRKSDKKLELFLKRCEGNTAFKIDKKNYDAHCFCKSRVVDPLFKTKGSIKRLSRVDKNWAKTVKEDLRPKEYFIKFQD